MSSAAVQRSTPQQYTQDSTGRDRYGSHPNVSATASPSSSSRRGERSYAPGQASTPDSPQSSRYAVPQSTIGRSHIAGTSAEDSMPALPYVSDHAVGNNSSSVLPIRTAAQYVSAPSPTNGSFDARSGASRTSHRQPGGYDVEEEQEYAKKRQQTYTSKIEPSDPATSHRSRHGPSSSRSTTAVGQTPIDTTLQRENSAIINHIVVDDPRTDLAREKARIAEAQPHPIGVPGPDVPGITGPVPFSNAEPVPTQPQQRSRQEHLRQAHAPRKEVKFGDYILGQTLGEGEFGKVKMGWKKESSVQVAIKLIRKESLAGNTTRLPKIYREISILRELQHPNIVRLHEFVETERHMGIILEYASGGELFDYILNHRYLKDPAARRLFAQLVSGVGYLHKKGIVHRDLKLENLLLDRNRNIIITDFGFANTFNPNDDLGEDVERRISDKDFIKSRGLDAVRADGHRRGDLMQTSCGSPCYAAPELVVSDGLYTGRKVDVWSCGVILYAMLAGYLPFDDDPANPEGDNINLLYKYIVSTPLTFPEYVTPHARDLLRRILVPDPRKRADLFEVARHSWLSEYSHVVGFIGSSTRSDRDIAASAAQQDGQPMLGRSASVREPSSRSQAAMAAANYQRSPAVASPRDETSEGRSQQRDDKRRTVQVEYVPPKPANQWSEAGQRGSPHAVQGRTRARPDSLVGPVEVSPNTVASPRRDNAGVAMSPPTTRPPRVANPRGTSDSNVLSTYAPTTASRPNTGGGFAVPRLPSRGNSYSTPVAATPTTENAQGRFSQPKPNNGYLMNNSPSAEPTAEVRPASQQNLGQFPKQPQQMPRSHKRSSTLGSIGDRLLGRSNSRRSQQQAPEPTPQPSEKKNRKYPPVSMRNNMTGQTDDPQPRPSSESRRTSFGFSRKNSDMPSEKRHSRRFSFLPNNFSISSLGSGKKDHSNEEYADYNGRPASKGMSFGRASSPSPERSIEGSVGPVNPQMERESSRSRYPPHAFASQPASRGSRYDKAAPPQPLVSEPPPAPLQRKQFRDDGYGGNLLNNDDESERYYTPLETTKARPDEYSHAGPARQQRQQQQTVLNDGYEYEDMSADTSRQDVPQGIRPTQRRFEDAYDQGHAGSSSGARRVMDFFRRRGKERSMT